MTLKDIDINAVFTIKNNQSFGEHEELLEVSTEGGFYLRNGSYFLVYNEYTELGEISVLIKVSGDRVVIRRSGACQAKMEYRKDFKQEVLYQIPYGGMLIDLETEEVINGLHFDGGYLELVYKLTVNRETYHNRMRLDVAIIDE